MKKIKETKIQELERRILRLKNEKTTIYIPYPTVANSPYQGAFNQCPFCKQILNPNVIHQCGLPYQSQTC